MNHSKKEWNAQTINRKRERKKEWMNERKETKKQSYFHKREIKKEDNYIETKKAWKKLQKWNKDK